MALQVFDCYMGCRERLHQVRIGELESNRHLMTDRAICPSRLTRDKKKALVCRKLPDPALLL